MPRLDAEFVARALDTAAVGAPPDGPFTGVSTDSRRVEPGQLFVALEGPRFDGHDFVAAALEAGAAGAVVRRGFSLPERPGACLFPVADTTRALGDLAAAWRREHSARVVAVTGSNGKTTTKEMLAAVLGRRHRVLRNRGNFNNHVGLPLTLLTLSGEHTAVVVEMGMNAPGEIARLTQIAAPEVGLVTNVGPAHLGRLGSLEAIAAAKAELYQGLGPGDTAVVNADDPLLAPWAGRLACRVVTFGSGEGAMVRAGEADYGEAEVRFRLELPGAAPCPVRLPVPGRHNLMNALAAAAAAWVLGLGSEEIAAGLADFAPVPGRFSPRRAPGGYTVIDDTYNANPASLAAGLEALAARREPGRRVLILGDMRELGPEAPRLHREAGGQAVAAGCALVWAVGRFAEEVAAGARAAGLAGARARAFADQRELAAAARESLRPEDVVLVKGSRSAGMERVVAALLGEEVD